jgi:hypothetical protein
VCRGVEASKANTNVGKPGRSEAKRSKESERGTRTDDKTSLGVDSASSGSLVPLLLVVLERAVLGLDSTRSLGARGSGDSRVAFVVDHASFWI